MKGDNLCNSYLCPPRVIPDPGPAYGAATRKFQGIPSLACGRDGRLWVVWYGGRTPGEDRNNYVMLAVSHDNGKNWSDEILVIDPDGAGPVRAFDPEIWLAPDGRLWLFWAQGIGHVDPSMRNGVWTMTADKSVAGNDSAWPAPRRLCDGVMMCKPVVRANGEWCLPVSLWQRREDGSAAIWVSGDNGASWIQRGACDIPQDIRSYDEHMIVERHDESLWMLVRTKCGIGSSVSMDGGRTWSALRRSGIPHVCSRFFIRRLLSGRLLLVRHDPADGDFADGKNGGTRSHLAAYLSEDDGRSWPYRLLLDERTGVSYPDGDQDEAGNIYIVYDYRRKEDREILMAVFDEQDVEKGMVSPQTRLRVLINKATA